MGDEGGASKPLFTEQLDGVNAERGEERNTVRQDYTVVELTRSPKPRGRT